MNMCVCMYNKTIYVKVSKFLLKMSMLKLLYCQEKTISLSNGNKIPMYALYEKYTENKQIKTNGQMLK